MNTLRYISLSCILAGCATQTVTPEVARIQVLKQDSVLISQCQVLGPIDAAHKAIAPAQEVYDVALNKLRGKAAALGADALAINTTTDDLGVSNKILLQGAALKCY